MRVRIEPPSISWDRNEGSYTGPAGVAVMVQVFDRRGRPVNNAGAGNTATVSITVTDPTDPQPPTELYAAGISGNLVKLRFKAPTSGPAPTGYLLEGGVTPGQVLASIPTNSTNPIYVFSAPSGVFYVRMHTLVGSARSVASNEIRIYVNASVDPPSAPAHLTGLANGNSVALAWRNPRVDIFLWFLLRDEARLGGWQSGLTTVTGKRKASFRSFQRAVEQYGA